MSGKYSIVKGDTTTLDIATGITADIVDATWTCVPTLIKTGEPPAGVATLPVEPVSDDGVVRIDFSDIQAAELPVGTVFTVKVTANDDGEITSSPSAPEFGIYFTLEP